ncbi:hypothetical protein [Streptomyces sp. TRM70350]|uniref:hypothetical protein n=1 Tax=Streptomyces sp. TRM70350 TaxID=2856165 RepID=UPI00210F6B92|nr:hypothetical protein [Streptomyces sp. TRM70350]
MRQEAGRKDRFVGVLKINCASASVGGTKRAVIAAQKTGFDEVMLDVPWQAPEQVFRNSAALSVGLR